MGALRILADADVRAVMNAEIALDLARRTLLDQAAGGSRLSAPSAMALDAVPQGGPRFKFKAAVVGHLAASGIRLLAHPGPTAMQTANFCAVYDHGDFHLAGLVAEHWLSRVRTAAFGTVSVQPLVNPGALVITMFGAGGIADEMVPMLKSALQIRELRVSSRRAESMDAFAARHGCRAEPDGRKAVEGADLVITLTESPTPLVFPGTLKPGAVVCSMGSYNELDFGVLGEAQRFVVDDPDFAAEMGDGGAWIAQGRITRENFMARVDAQACDVVAGKAAGRRSPTERIVALIQGMAIGDVAFAAQALRAAEKRNLGRVVEI